MRPDQDGRLNRLLEKAQERLVTRAVQEHGSRVGRQLQNRRPLFQKPTRKTLILLDVNLAADERAYADLKAIRAALEGRLTPGKLNGTELNPVSDPENGPERAVYVKANPTVGLKRGR